MSGSMVRQILTKRFSQAEPEAINEWFSQNPDISVGRYYMKTVRSPEGYILDLFELEYSLRETPSALRYRVERVVEESFPDEHGRYKNDKQLIREWADANPSAMIVNWYGGRMVNPQTGGQLLSYYIIYALPAKKKRGKAKLIKTLLLTLFFIILAAVITASGLVLMKKLKKTDSGTSDGDSINITISDETVAYTLTGGYNMRSEPNGDLIVSLPAGSIVYGTGNMTEDKTWIEVYTGDGLYSGWIYAEGLMYAQ